MLQIDPCQDKPTTSSSLKIWWEMFIKTQVEELESLHINWTLGGLFLGTTQRHFESSEHV